MLLAVSFLQPTPTIQTPPHRRGTPSPCDTFVPELLPGRNVHLSHTHGTNFVLWGREPHWICVGVLTAAQSGSTRLREKQDGTPAANFLLVNRNQIKILIPTLMWHLFLSCTRPEVGCFYKFIWGKWSQNLGICRLIERGWETRNSTDRSHSPDKKDTFSFQCHCSSLCGLMSDVDGGGGWQRDQAPHQRTVLRKLCQKGTSSSLPTTDP